MNKQAIWRLLPMFLMAAFALNLSGQVSIGSSEPPSPASLLEIKDREATAPVSVTDANNVTAETGGLILSRVRLVNLRTLEPFIATTATEWNAANINRTKRKHAGLMVYNIYVSPSSVTDTDKQFDLGIYVWDGEKWSQTGVDSESKDNKRWFYMPAFNLPLPKITGSGPDETYDIYGEYARQFTQSGNATYRSNNGSLARIPSPISSRLYAKTELDYAVIYYDDSIVRVTGIDNNGIMSYKVLDNDPGPTSFMNIVFIVK
ncbi:hypothetical protein [Dysgonomonas sp. 520]|uniref:hypothetical protein n=1 Tax=Dysgonomonas sp. 520 TaxID=2302931 RepID=UPI0013D8491E|nr:hypothetical protein [Dysgonomonas sp. 520]NDW09971.1 hypothetical protein [Dysgonomonas sp. 520]